MCFYVHRRLAMDDTALPPVATAAAVPHSSNNSGVGVKTESRKRYGPASDGRPKLIRGRFALSRRASFDVGGGSWLSDAAETSPSNSTARFIPYPIPHVSFFQSFYLSCTVLFFSLVFFCSVLSIFSKFIYHFKILISD